VGTVAGEGRLVGLVINGADFIRQRDSTKVVITVVMPPRRACYLADNGWVRETAVSNCRYHRSNPVSKAIQLVVRWPQGPEGGEGAGLAFTVASTHASLLAGRSQLGPVGGPGGRDKGDGDVSGHG
jgi:hypothetical protein